MFIQNSRRTVEFWWEGNLRWPLIGLVIGKFSCSLYRDDFTTHSGFISETHTDTGRGVVGKTYGLGMWSLEAHWPSKRLSAQSHESA